MNRTGISLCEKCPLRDRRRVWADTCEDPRIAIVGEAPGAEEERTGHPFVGPAGAELGRALASAGIRRAGCHTTNVLDCRPPGNEISTEEAEEALRCCMPGFDAEIAGLVSRGVRVIIALGNTAAHALGVEENITKARGSIYLLDVRSGSPDVSRDNGGSRSIPIIPTYHPAAILYSREKTIARGTGSSYASAGPSSAILRPVFIADLKKARAIAESPTGYTPPEERFILPSNDISCRDQTLGFLQRCVENRSSVGIDIETTSWEPDTGRIFCIGISDSGTSAVCIDGGTLENDKQIRIWTERVTEQCPSIFQNAKFDVKWLEEAGFRVGNLTHDVMLAHHAVSPELPHDLGFIVSIYGNTPYWKGEMLKRDVTIEEMDPQKVYRYNARDAVVLHQVLPGLLEDMKETGSERAYQEISMKMIRPIMHMEAMGMKVSRYRITKWKEELQQRKKEEENVAKARIGCNVVSFSSDDELRYVLFGVQSRKMENVEQLLKEKASRPNTKIYKELERIKKVKDISPLFSEAFIGVYLRIRATGMGKMSVADGTLISVSRIAMNRARLIERFVRPTEAHKAEMSRLLVAVEFIERLRTINQIDKLISTYTEFPIRADGRVHPSFLIHGTTTGRLSCKSPNLQNQPEVARIAFVAEEGKILLSADYSNLELRVLAYISEDDVMLRMFEEGKNIHDENTKTLFGINEEHPKWKPFRKAAKIYIFGRNYGGSVEGIFERVLSEVPDCNLTLARFREVDEHYRRLHPRYASWYERTRTEVLQKRQIANAFGRVRIFHGNEYDIVKEGLNTPIQGTAADIINTATIRIDNAGIPIICQVHDQLLFEIEKGMERSVADVVRPLMEREFEINGQTACFPVDITSGECWGKMVPLPDGRGTSGA